MVVVVIDASTILSFVNDEARFQKSMDEAFTALDLNKDGVLSRPELQRELESLRLMEIHFGVDVATPAEEVARVHEAIFCKFDSNNDGTVDREEFGDEMKKILVGIAEGLGFCPILMALEDDDDMKTNFLKQAVEFEASNVSAN